MRSKIASGKKIIKETRRERKRRQGIRKGM
jgi:hypothetical protein